MFSWLSGKYWYKKSRVLEPVLQRTLSNSRYRHAIRVAHVARLLAGRHGVNPGKAWFAGLSHDLAREWSEDRLLAWVAEYGAFLEPAHTVSPILAHGHAAAWLLGSTFGVRSPSVLDAVAHHTLGYPGLDRLGLIIFAADYLEPGRKFTTLSFRRWALHLDLYEMVLACMAHNEARGKSTSPLTQAFREHLSKSVPGAIVFADHPNIKDLRS